MIEFFPLTKKVKARSIILSYVIIIIVLNAYCFLYKFFSTRFLHLQKTDNETSG